LNKRQWSAVSGLAVGALVATGLAAPLQAQATPTAAAAVSSDPAEAQASRRDNLPNPLAEAAAARRKDAVDKLVRGKATTTTIKGNRVIAVKSTTGITKYVDYPVNREESIFTILSEFSDMGHNEIAAPDRSMDNSTYWTTDFSREHFADMMFGDGESFKDFYQKQSNGRFLAKGDVSDWVQVKGEAATYGDNDNEQAGYWAYITDTVNAWYDAQIKAGKSAADVDAYLKQFDQVDRYDHDGDGVFLEPDGYIDHFQAIHAGEGEEAGGGTLGADAIWSHRWYVNSTDVGSTGPQGNKLGGAKIGGSNLWVGDYTTEPENGGLGVFAHEFGHDLGLPDLYDTAGGDNTTGFWTLMSGGSWLNQGGDSIGTTPGYMGPWEKLQLGWLDYKVTKFGEDASVMLGAADRASTTTKQAVVVPLPERTVIAKRNTPYAGSAEWWSGYGDDLNNTLTRTVDLTGVSTGSVSAFVQGNLEAGYDYLYAEASSDGVNWTKVGAPIDGTFAWTQKTWDLSAFAGKAVQFRFRIQTDGGVSSEAFLDDIAVTVGGTTTTDTVENGAGTWTAKGFSIIDGTTTKQVTDFYLAENRVYSGYDATLQKGPYNFGFANTKPDWVERFPYQNGMLVWFSNGEFSNNNTSAHPGGGEALPVDARPVPVTFYDGKRLGNRRQPFDATFGLEATDAVTFHKNGIPTEVPSSAAIPTFDDTNVNQYWDDSNPWASTKVGGTGTKITVDKSFDGGNVLLVKVDFK
jgi:immune inhibitor A